MCLSECVSSNDEGHLYHFLIEEFHQSRGFVLELMVVIILLIELGYLFHGKV